MLFSLEGVRARLRGVPDTGIKRGHRTKEARGGRSAKKNEHQFEKEEKESRVVICIFASFALSLFIGYRSLHFSPASSRWGARREEPAAPTRTRRARRPRGGAGAMASPPTPAAATDKRQRRGGGLLLLLLLLPLLRGATPPRSCSRCGAAWKRLLYGARVSKEKEREGLCRDGKVGKDLSKAQARVEASLGEF